MKILSKPPYAVNSTSEISSKPDQIALPFLPERLINSDPPTLPPADETHKEGRLGEIIPTFHLDLKTEEIRPKVKGLPRILRKAVKKGAPVGERSEKIFFVVTSLLERGWAQSEIITVLTSAEFGISAKILEASNPLTAASQEVAMVQLKLAAKEAKAVAIITYGNPHAAICIGRDKNDWVLAEPFRCGFTLRVMRSQPNPGNIKVIRLFCGKWSCPTCGTRMLEQWQEHLHQTINWATADGKHLYLIQCDSEDWQRIRKAIERAGKQIYGRRGNYVAFRLANSYRIISEVPISSGVLCMEIPSGLAQKLIDNTLKNLPLGRGCISASKKIAFTLEQERVIDRGWTLHLEHHSSEEQYEKLFDTCGRLDDARDLARNCGARVIQYVFEEDSFTAIFEEWNMATQTAFLEGLHNLPVPTTDEVYPSLTTG